MISYNRFLKGFVLFALLLLVADNINAKDKRISDTEADSIILKSYSFVRNNGWQIDTLRSRTYSSFYTCTHVRNGLIRLLPRMEHFRRGRREYAGEAMIDYSCMGEETPGVTFRAFRCVGNKGPVREILAKSVQLSIYSPLLIYDERIISPFNAEGKKYYHYKVSSTHVSPAGNIAAIEIEPRSRIPSLVSGVAFIEKNSGRVDSVHLNWASDCVLGVTLDMKLGKDGIYSMLPYRSNMDITYSFGRNKVNYLIRSETRIDKIAARDNLSILPGKKQKVRKAHMPKYSASPDTSKIILSDATRFFALNNKEDSILSIPKETFRKQNSSGRNVADILDEVFLSRHSYKISPLSATINIPRLIAPEMIRWGGTRGLSVSRRLKISATNKYGHEIISFRPIFGYSFKQNQFYWDLPLNALLVPRYNIGFKAEIGNGNRIYNNDQAETLRREMQNISKFDSLRKIIENYNFNYYDDLFLKNSFYIDPIEGFHVEIGSVFHKRTLVNWRKDAERLKMMRIIRSFAPRIEVEYTPRPKSPTKDASLVSAKPYTLNYSKEVGSPIIRASFERGLRALSNGNSYEKYEFDIAQYFGLANMRSLYLRGAGGFFTKGRNTWFVDFDNFSYHDMPSDWDDDMAGEFHLLDKDFYNESTYYILLSSSLTSPPILCGRIPFLSKTIKQENIYISAAVLHALYPYMEYGYGISTPLCDLAVFFSSANFKNIKIGARFTLRFFDDL